MVSNLPPMKMSKDLGPCRRTTYGPLYGGESGDDLAPLSTYTCVAPSSCAGTLPVSLRSPVRRVGRAGRTAGGVAAPSATGAVESVGWPGREFLHVNQLR